MKKNKTLTKKLRKVRLEEQFTSGASLDHAICYTYHRRSHAEVHRYARLRAAKRIGVRNRDYRSAPSFRPKIAEIESFTRLPGDEGGFAGQRVDVDSSLSLDTPRLLDQFAEQMRPVDPHHRRPITKEILDMGAADVRYLSYGLLRAPRRKYTPPWSVPTEVLCMVFSPTWLSKFEKRKPVIGIDPFELPAETSEAAGNSDADF